MHNKYLEQNQFHVEKNQYTSFMKRKSTWNKFHEQKSANSKLPKQKSDCNRFDKQNQFYEGKKSMFISRRKKLSHSKFYKQEKVSTQRVS